MSRVAFKIDGVMVLTVAVGALAIYAGYKLTKNSDAIIASINPASDQNLVYQLANWGWSPIIGEHDTIGTWVFDQVQGVKNTGAAIYGAATQPVKTGEAFLAWLQNVGS